VQLSPRAESDPTHGHVTAMTVGWDGSSS